LDDKIGLQGQHAFLARVGILIHPEHEHSNDVFPCSARITMKSRPNDVAAEVDIGPSLRGLLDCQISHFHDIPDLESMSPELFLFLVWALLYRDEHQLAIQT